MDQLFKSFKKGILGTFNFTGNSNRFEFVSYYIFIIIFHFVASFLISKFLLDLDPGPFLIIFWSVRILEFISLLANVSRRLKNLDMSKWYLILIFIPIIGFLFSIYLCFKNKA